MIETLLVTAGAIIVLYATVFSDISRTAEIWLTYGGVCIAAAAPFAYAQQQHWDKQKVVGVLTPGSGKSPTYPPSSKVNTVGATYMLFADSVCVIAREFPYTVIRQDGEDLLVLAKENGAVQISTSLFDVFGNPLGEIKDNRYEIVLPDGYKHASGPHHLTILDESSSVVIKIELINPDTLKISGAFHLRGGEPIKMNDGLEYRNFSIAELTVDSMPSPLISIESGKVLLFPSLRPNQATKQPPSARDR